MQTNSKTKSAYSSKYDVIIVGAGMAGVTLAFHLATAGKKVIVFEKKRREEVGENWSDSIELKAFEFGKIPFPQGNEMKSEINKLSILSPDLEYKVDISPYRYLIVDRKLYHHRLVKLAEKAGAKFEFGIEIVEPIGKGQWVVGVKNKDGKIVYGQVIVDSSGYSRILAKNIEVLDLNINIKEDEIAEAYREIHSYNADYPLFWNKFKIEPNNLYYRYGYKGGYSWINIEEKDKIDLGAGINPVISKKSAKSIVHEMVQLSEGIGKSKVRGGGGKIIVRRPVTLVWYGFIAVGEAACLTIPTNGCGCGTAIISAKIAAEVLINALKRKEVGIDRLWEYQIRFTKERGRDLAALDAMRRIMLQFGESEITLLMKKGIISGSDLKQIIHGKFPKQSLFTIIIKIFKGIRDIKLLLKLNKGIRKAKKIYNHYKNIPKEYDTKKYHEWLIKQLYFFNELQNDNKKEKSK